ncbi:MAG: DUF1080 domain-containing protein, partial [Planctomycetota bacterium]|nr:DUF1080 domain-containing protein [Planctomycetota bacterium]
MRTFYRILSLWFLILSVVGCNDSPGMPATAQPTAAASVTQQVAAAVDFVAPSLTEEEIRAGWISLFDGRTLFGWDVPTETNWHVEDGAIVVDSGEKSLLLTPFHFDDFELRCSFHVAEGGNSGIFLRTANNASDPAKDTYELNICDGHP